METPSCSSTTPQNPSPLTTQSRACDACRRRKVKCHREGTGACIKCTTSQLYCTFDDPIQKKGPRLNRLRHRRTTQAPLSRRILPCVNSLPTSTSERHNYDAETSALLIPHQMSDISLSACLEYFFARFHPHVPIVDWQYAFELKKHIACSPEAYCVVLSLCAYTLLASLDCDIVDPREEVNAMEALSKALIECVVKTRQTWDVGAADPAPLMITATFLYLAHERLNKTDFAWFFLREATTLAHSANLHQESHYKLDDATRSSRERCIYWFLFTSERAYALYAHRPVTLHATIVPPTSYNVELGPVQLSGLSQLVALFKPFDCDIPCLWNFSDNSSESAASLLRAQQQVRDAMLPASLADECQNVDLLCSQAWIHVTLWQAALRNSLLSFDAPDEAMTFKFPLKVASDLALALKGISLERLRVHGTFLTEKLFEVTCCLVDVARCMATIGQLKKNQALGLVKSLLSTIAKLPGGSTRYVPIVLSKLNEIDSGSLHIDGNSSPIIVCAALHLCAPTPIRDGSKTSTCVLAFQQPSLDLGNESEHNVWYSETLAIPNQKESITT